MAKLSIKKTIAVIGLDYVGLPLTVEFGKVRPVIGFDINVGRIDSLRVGHDATLEYLAQQSSRGGGPTYSEAAALPSNKYQV